MEKSAVYLDTKERLLAVGEELIRVRGFTALGLSEILSSAKVPKGSFYHYFQSKEGFGVALLERYFSDYDRRLATLFADVGMSGVDARIRIMGYFDLWRSISAESNGCIPICLAVKLAAEVADLSEPMRCALESGMGRITFHLTGVIRQAQAEGSVSLTVDASEFAEILYSMWLGASLLSKVKHSLLPFDLVYKQTASMLQL